MMWSNKRVEKELISWEEHWEQGRADRADGRQMWRECGEVARDENRTRKQIKAGSEKQTSEKQRINKIKQKISELKPQTMKVYTCVIRGAWKSTFHNLKSTFRISSGAFSPIVWPSSANGLLSSHEKWRKCIYSSIMNIISVCTSKLNLMTPVVPSGYGKCGPTLQVTESCKTHYCDFRRSGTKWPFSIILSDFMLHVAWVCEQAGWFPLLWPVTVTPASCSITPCYISGWSAFKFCIILLFRHQC